MPHRCMECKNILESGEMDIKTGCPVCGGKKFQYIRPHAKEKDVRKLTVAEYVAHASAAEEDRRPREASKHKKADVAAATEKPKPVEKEKKPEKPAHERIESVRIVEKGLYDINLPMLLNRKELVMSKEDGVYVVDLPSALKIPKKKKR
jgi:predicted  nucleic acid-binding Zn-ribbon protein